MCGILGIIGSDNIPLEVIIGIGKLQYRGPHSAGVHFHIHDGEFAGPLERKKGIGKVKEVFTKEDVEYFKSLENVVVGLGHVRYITVGSDKDAQPLFMPGEHGVSMGHNGNLIDYQEHVRRMTAEGNYRRLTKCDIEVPLYIFSKALRGREFNSKSIFEAIRSIHSPITGVNGAYSIVAAGGIEKQALIAFKDLQGIRPLSFGIKETKDGLAYALSSENMGYEPLGYEYQRELYPGEAMIIWEDGTIENRLFIKAEDGTIEARPLTEENIAIAEANQRFCHFEYVYFSHQGSILLGQLASEARERMGANLAEHVSYLMGENTIIVPVLDSGRDSALGLSKELGVYPVEAMCRDRTVHTRAFMINSPHARKAEAIAKHDAIRQKVQDNKIIVVDDSAVRGDTSAVLARKFYDAGAKEVHLRLASPPIKFPCYYGIDTPTREELVAHGRDWDGIAAHIGVDSVAYPSIDDHLGAINRNVCTACLNAEYPTDISCASEFSCGRIADRGD